MFGQHRRNGAYHAEPRCGSGDVGGLVPRVGLFAFGQPWAGMRNPVGIGESFFASGLRRTSCRLEEKRLKRKGAKVAKGRGGGRLMIVDVTSRGMKTGNR